MNPGGLAIDDHTSIPESELNVSAIRAGGPGGQHVNKVATAVQLQFDVKNSAALSTEQKERIMRHADRRIAASGIVTIKAQRFRSQEQNKLDAYGRLQVLLASATRKAKRRIATRPGKNAKEKRLDNKARRSRTKQLRGKTFD